MYVDPTARGHGVGRLILSALVDHAHGLGVRLVRLETGVKQPEALALYRSAGFFKRRGVYHPYVAHPISVFMEKTL